TASADLDWAAGAPALSRKAIVIKATTRPLPLCGWPRLSYCHTILCELCFSFKAMGASEEKRRPLMLAPVSRSSARPSLSNADSVALCAQAGTPNEPEIRERLRASCSPTCTRSRPPLDGPPEEADRVRSQDVL